MQGLIVENFGRMVSNEIESNAPGAGQIRVAVKYAGVGFADVMAVRGGYPLAPARPFSPGYEFTGVVDAVGSKVSGLECGQRVCGMIPHMNGYRKEIVIDAKWAVAIPDAVSDTLAAQLPLNYITAIALIEYYGQLKKGDSLFIHGAAGGVGTAVLEIAGILGIIAYGGASPLKHEQVKSLGGIPVDYTKDDWVQTFCDQLPEGVNAAFDAFGGKAFRSAWSVLRKDGIIISYGFSPTVNGGLWPMIKGIAGNLFRKLLPGKKRTALCGAPALIEGNPDWYKNNMQRILEWAGQGLVNSNLHAIVEWNKADEAHDAIIERKVKGKVILDFSK